MPRPFRPLWVWGGSQYLTSRCKAGLWASGPFVKHWGWEVSLAVLPRVTFLEVLAASPAELDQAQDSGFLELLKLFMPHRTWQYMQSPRHKENQSVESGERGS